MSQVKGVKKLMLPVGSPENHKEPGNKGSFCVNVLIGNNGFMVGREVCWWVNLEADLV